MQVSVCGPSAPTGDDERNAYRVGELLAERGAVVICGGGPGVMAAVAAGARARGGLVVGVRPDSDPATASPDLSVAVLTGMGDARNAIIVNSADAVIAIGGSWGTLSEFALAVGSRKTLVFTGPVPADTPEQAVDLALGNNLAPVGSAS